MSLSNSFALNRRRFLQYGAIALGSGLATACGSNSSTTSSTTPSSSASPSAAQGLDRVTLATDWVAQAEHGGFYQAIATGIYQEYGLDVKIRMGGPQAATGTQLLFGKVVDFAMSNSTIALNAVAEGVPKVTVAAMFQKDPRCIVAHPGVKDLAELKGKPLFVTPQAVSDFWGLLAKKYGFTDSQRRVYNFNPAPFLADKTSAQQGFVTSEPYTIEKEGGIKPAVFLLADVGYKPYATTIDTTAQMIADKPDVVKRFVQASSKGWYSYLANSEPGNALIKKDYPEMSDDRLAYGISKLKEYGIVLSGDAMQNGIGYMTETRWKDFFEEMVEFGVYPKTLDYRKAFTLDFVQDLPKSA